MNRKNASGAGEEGSAGACAFISSASSREDEATRRSHVPAVFRISARPVGTGGTAERQRRGGCIGKLKGGSRRFVAVAGMNDRAGVNGGDPGRVRTRGKQMPVDLRGYAFVEDNGSRARADRTKVE